MAYQPSFYSDAFSVAHEALDTHANAQVLQGVPFDKRGIELSPELLERINPYVPPYIGQLAAMHARVDERIEPAQSEETLPPTIILEGEHVIADPSGDGSKFTLSRTYFLHENPGKTTVIEHATDPDPDLPGSGKANLHPFGRDEGSLALAALLTIGEHYRS